MAYTLKKLTPNLIVANVERSVAFYCDVLGFTREIAVPDDGSPLVFASVRSEAVEIFLNAQEPAIAEYPAFAGRPIGGTLTMFIEVDEIERVHAELQSRAPIVMPLERKWYGVTEFAITDPDGYIITFAQR